MDNAILIRGAEIPLEKAKRMRIRDRIEQVNCGICGAAAWYDPAKSLLPELCSKCTTAHEQYIKACGLGLGRRKAPCIDCGKTLVVSTNPAAVRLARCRKCKVRHERKVRDEKAVVDPEVRRRRLENAMTMLRRQYGIKSYEAPLGVIATKIDKPGWWDSAPEIMMTAEFLRLGYKVKPQFKIYRHYTDIYLPEQNLVVEVDGIIYHGSNKAIRRDIRLDAMAILDGYSVVRVSSELVATDVRKAARSALREATSAKDYRLTQEMLMWRSGSALLENKALKRAIDQISFHRIQADEQRLQQNRRR